MKTNLKRILFSALTFSLVMPLALMGASAESGDTNIVLNLPYTVETGVDISHSYALAGTETDTSLGLLTNGVYAPRAHYSAEGWHVFYRGLSRSVIFELPEEKAVTGFAVSLLLDNGAGIDMSDYYDLYVSENGTDYMLMASVNTSDLSTGTQSVRHVVSRKNLNAVKARYVKVKFRVSVAAYIDEIEIFGGKVTGTEQPFVKYKDPTVYPNKYDSGVEGCKDLVLLYCGYNNQYDISYVQNTEEEMLYYCGYIGKDGTVKDTMFDSIMFSPLGNTLPSGRTCSQNGDSPLMSDWQFYIDSIFDPEYNCGAIERALDTVKAATGKSDYKMKLVITMPYPNISASTAFGDIDGDGTKEYCRNTDDQLRIFAWFMDACIEKMASREYKNIELGGFYWEAEGINVKLGESEYTFIHNVSELIHERGTSFFWIPFLYGNGFDRWQDMGFDSVMMQPNLSFLDYATPEMIAELDKAVRKYGMGFEMEIHWDVAQLSSAYINKFYSYLNAGYALGYMENSSHSYYQNSNPGTFYVAGKSNSASLRAIYDDVYAFIKHTYVPKKPVISARSVTTEVNERVYGYVRVTGVFDRSIFLLDVMEEPKHGTLELNPKTGDFAYTPEDGFNGTDSFIVCGKGNYVTADPYEIVITVGDGGGEQSEISEQSEPGESGSSTTDNSSVSENDTSAEASESANPADETSNIALIVGAAVLALTAIATAMLLIVRKTKREKA